MIRIIAEQSGVAPSLRFSRTTLLAMCAAFARALPLAQGSVQCVFVDESEIRRLNRMYRKKDAVTDVLSFPSGDQEISGVLGDVLLCVAQAQRQATDGDVQLECVDLLVHGILHLLGYDHERAEDAEVMFPLQDRIVAETLRG